MSKKIIVIGGGPAGIEAALTAAKVGASVTLVSDTPIGGRAGWASLVPSKVWLHAADLFGAIQAGPRVGIALDGGARPDPDVILARIRTVMQGWNGQLVGQLQAQGVTLVTGSASLVSSTTVQIAHDGVARELEADAIIIAAGSVPAFPPTMRPDGKRILAPRFAKALDSLPASVVVVGGGATGTEFAYLFNRLGVEVTWVLNEKGVLPMFAPGAGDFLADIMAKRGVNLIMGQAASNIATDDDGVTVSLADGSAHTAEMAFLAIGRRADVSRLNIDATGLALGAHGELAVDEYGRTSAATVYAVGDVVGAPMLANQAAAQARVAARHAAGLMPPPYRPETIIHAIYADPQVAQVGRTNAGDKSVRIPFTAALKAHLLVENEGYIELRYDAGTRAIQTGIAVGPHAADVLAPVALALQLNATVDDLAAPGGANPTLSELAFMAAQACVCEQ